MRVAIVDDEPLALSLIVVHSKRIPALEVVGTFTSANEALIALTENPVDLVFLDIQMPGLSGMELARRLPLETMVIFTTAFDQYAVESYSVAAIYYLLKPVTFEAFEVAVTKALERKTTLSQYRDDSFFYVKKDHKRLKVYLRDVLYIEGLKDYVKIYLCEGHIVTLMNMKSLEDFLPSPEFLRVHRSFIVHMSMASRANRCNIYFHNTVIPVSERYREVVQNYIEANSPE